MRAAPDCLVSVFAKAPVPGLVKTRLIPRLGAAGAARFHDQGIRRALDTARAAAIGAVELCCAPDASDVYFQRLATAHGVALTSQGEGDLGERMWRALARGVGSHRAAILIGADIPALTPGDLQDAARALHSHDVVVAPAEDGGFVLIGVRTLPAPLFAGIPWSSGEVMTRLRRNLATLGLATAELRTLWDVDRPDDYARAEAEGLVSVPPVSAGMTSKPAGMDVE